MILRVSDIDCVPGETVRTAERCEEARQGVCVYPGSEGVFKAEGDMLGSCCPTELRAGTECIVPKVSILKRHCAK